MQGVKTMYMNKVDWIFVTIIFLTVSALMSWAIWSSVYGQIDSESYDQVHSWSKDFPEIRLMVETATWEDNKIDFSEFLEIKKAAIPLLIRDARGENE